MVNTKAIISLIINGKNFSQVARELDYSRNTVKSHFWDYVQNHSIPIPNLWGMTDKDIMKIVNRKQDGEAAQSIADDFGVSKSYIYKLVKKWS